MSPKTSRDLEDATPRIHIGCAGIPGARAGYGKVLSLVELRSAYVQPPRPKTGAGWKDELGEGCEVALVAWQLVTGVPEGSTWRGLAKPIAATEAAKYGAFKDTDEVWQAWEHTSAVADAMRARAILFSCPPNLTPTAENKGRIKKFFARIERRTDQVLALEVAGVWEQDDARSLADDLGVVLATDPLHDDSAQSGEIAYFRLRGPVTGRYRYDENDLDELRERSAGYRESFVVFHGVEMWSDAKRFAGRVAAKPD